MYVYNTHDVSEEILLGIGAGVGFSYWHFKGQPPFMGGRSMPKPSMEEIAGQRTGVTHVGTPHQQHRRQGHAQGRQDGAQVAKKTLDN